MSALLSAALKAEANNLERIAVLEGGLSGVAQAAAAAQTALADAASQGESIKATATDQFAAQSKAGSKLYIASCWTTNSCFAA